LVASEPDLPNDTFESARVSALGGSASQTEDLFLRDTLFSLRKKSVSLFLETLCFRSEKKCF